MWQANTVTEMRAVVQEQNLKSIGLEFIQDFTASMNERKHSRCMKTPLKLMTIL